MARMKVRARAVDMLGRQQIAGIPTAIHELFKNSHDAYAENVEADFYRADHLFVLRDNGIGMTKVDFESKWLTLGTESKVNANTTKPEFIPEGKTARITMGEKGIGRLAIATIGRQVLVMTRALRENGLSDLTVSLIHWSLFEVPGVDLDEIEIPVVEIKGGTLPDKLLISRLKDSIRQNVKNLTKKTPPDIRNRIYNDLDNFTFSPSEISSKIAGLSLTGDGYGTHFYILPADPLIENDLDGGSDDEASNIQKILLGFSNTMYADAQPVMRVSFKDHAHNGSVDEIIGGEAFFTPEEFEMADQHIEGSFDEFGQFQGKVSVYHGEPKLHVIHWSGGRGAQTECGPFKIRFAYLQGLPSESIVPVDRYGSLYSKGNKFGGLYIYRDGIRVLPYGRADYDFLEIERRRSKKASEGFFSYRRIFGAVEISHLTNSALIEKAGREGFRENIAFRQIKEILINFFKQLALDYFREGAIDNDFNELRTEMQKQADLIKKREQLIGAKKKKLNTELDTFFKNLESNYFAEKANEIRDSATREIDLVKKIPDPDQAADKLLKLESKVRNDISALKDDITVSRPRGVGLGKAIMLDWDAYQKNRAKLQSDLILPLERELDELITQVNESHIGVNRRLRIAYQLEDGKRIVQRRTSELKRGINDQLQLFQSELQGALHNKLKSLNGTVERVMIDFERSSAATLAEPELIERQMNWEGNIESALRETDEYLSSLRDQLKDLTDSLQQGELLGSETLEAVENRSEEYKEQLDRYFEFAQVGMSLGVVQHEFSSTVTRIRTCIKELKPWASGTAELAPLYEDIRHNFEHLDSYLDLFTPLNRRLYRKAKKFSGREVQRYLEDVFGERLERHGISLEHSTEFDKHTVNGFPSTIYPVFVNLLDNAIYWVNSDSGSEKIIRLDANEFGFLIWNGGPGIELRDADRVFEFGVSRKPNGRGMGLYISRESLKRDGFNLELLEAGENVHPTFLIRTTSDEATQIL